MDNKILESPSFHTQGTNYEVNQRVQNTHANQEKGHNYIYNVRAVTDRFRHTAIDHCTYKQAARENTMILVINKTQSTSRINATLENTSSVVSLYKSRATLG